MKRHFLILALYLSIVNILIQSISDVNEEIKILAISGGASTVKAKFLDLANLVGAHQVLQKPFGMNTLRRHVKELLN